MSVPRSGSSVAFPQEPQSSLPTRRTTLPTVTTDTNFDVFKFLNENSTQLLRDPTLQQMTVIRYEGDLDLSTGFFQGHGRLVSSLGYTYSGSFDRGLMHGSGKIEWNDGTVYEGTFQNNVISGKGKYTWPNGDWYEGGVENCIRHGQGTFFYKTLNETYEGGWQRGMRHGFGTLKYKPDSSCVYQGEWVKDRRCGKGLMRYDNGATYDGEWKDDIRHGFGVMVWLKNGMVVEEYKGEWVDGIPCGHGTSTYIRPPQSFAPSPPQPQEAAAQLKDSALNMYTGEFLSGMRHGFGTFIYDDGSKYEGSWEANLKHGEGKYTSATGVVYFGTFEKGSSVTPTNEEKPDTTVSSPLPLYIRDVLGESENTVGEAITAVQSVISRNNGVLKKVFNFYANLETAVDVVTTPANWKKTRTQGTISLLQFMRMCNEAKLINKHVSPALISRALLAFKDRLATTSSASYTTGEADVAPSLPHAPSQARLVAGGGEKTRSSEDGSITRSPTIAAVTPDQRNLSRISFSSHRNSKGSGKRGEYSAPWERYRHELYMFQGEMNFREFVEALVRIAALTYNEMMFGTLAQKMTLVIEEHLAPFTCSTTAVPLFALSREHKSVLLPYLPVLEKLFLRFSQATTLGMKNVSGPPNLSQPNISSSSLPNSICGVTMTMRQLIIMLKTLNVIDGEKISVGTLLKMVPFDQHPKLTTAILKKQFMTSIRVPVTGGEGTMTMDRASTVSAEEMAFTPESEATYRTKWAMAKRSKGIHNTNLHQTVCMEKELTFVEFVDLLMKVAVVFCNDGTPVQRVTSFLRDIVAPSQKTLVL